MEKLLTSIFDPFDNDINEILYIIDESNSIALKYLLPSNIYDKLFNNYNNNILSYEYFFNIQSFYISTFEFNQVIYIISNALDRTDINYINKINRQILENVNHNDIIISIITTTTQDYYNFPDETLKLPYEVIKSKFYNKINEIYYLPIHTIPIINKTALAISSEEFSSIRLFLLSNQYYKSLFPLMNKSVISIDNFDIDVIDKELNINDNNNNHEKLLHLLSYELSSALVYNYGLDPTNYIYALGKSSEKLGKQIQSNLKDTIESYDNIHESKKNFINQMYVSKSTKESLKPATLIIIDRQLDLYSPMSFGSDHTENGYEFINSFAHHVYSTIYNSATDSFVKTNILYHYEKLYYSPIDSTELSQVEKSVGVLFDDRAIIEKPFSALQSLQLQSNLEINIRYDQPAYMITLLSHLYLSSEEKFKYELILILKQIITNESSDKNLLNYKKRGFGAEILTLVQILAKISNRYLHYMPLISIALSTIECMQRSSIKQFNQVIPWSAAYDMKVSREINLYTYLRNRFDVINHSGINLHIFIVIEGLNYIIDSTNQQIKLIQSKDSTGVIDISFTIIQIIRLISISRHDMKEIDPLLSPIVNRLADILADVIVYFSNSDELNTFKKHEIISNDIITDLISLKSKQISISIAPINKEDDWEGWEDDIVDNSNDNNQSTELLKLKLELSDILVNFIEDMILYFGNIDSYNNISYKRKSNSSLLNASDLLSSYYLESSRGQFIGQRVGLLARTVLGISLYRDNLNNLNQNQQANEIMALNSYHHIESSLEHLKRAGLGLLSSGLGRLGLGSNALAKNRTKHPGDNNTIVIFILGGISMKEIRQINYALQQLLNQSVNTKDIEVIIGSNQIFVPDTFLKYSKNINK